MHDTKDHMVQEQAEVAKSLPKPEPEATKVPPKPRPEFRHPVLQAMGIPRVRVPSRNWLIFWSVCGVVGGLLYYDKRERKRVRQQWKDKVSCFAEQKMTAMELPRKVTIYIAPPPNDFLDVSMGHFRNYIKPILTAAALDFELISETQQGHIRTVVAEDARNQRRFSLGLPTSGYVKDDLDNKIESKVRRRPGGGVICIGRGAYKEYIAGIHEGYMGPLEEPEFVRVEIARKEKEKADKKREKAEKEKEKEKEKKKENSKDQTEQPTDSATISGLTSATGPSEPVDGAGASPEIETIPVEKPEPETKPAEKTKEQVVPSWIKVSEYDEAGPPQVPGKLDPISVMRHPHLLGILNTPFRIVRFLNQRKLADEMGRQTAEVVFGYSRPFEASDTGLASSDEEDWPKKWKQNGLDAGSEWMQECRVDERMLPLLSVYTSNPNAEVGSPSE